MLFQYVTKDPILNMISNSQNAKNQIGYEFVGKILGCFSLMIIIMAFTGNTVSFIIFRTDIHLKNISSFLILSFVAIIDNFALIDWNLNSFLTPFYGVKIH